MLSYAKRKVASGEVWLWGEEAAFEGRQDLVLMLNGALAQRNDLGGVPKHLPQADVVIGHMPGNHCPPIGDCGVQAAAAAFDEVLDQFGRPALVCGNSMGGVVAMAMRSPWVNSIVALDPFLRTGKVWPFEVYRERLQEEPGNARLATFLWNTFGISQTEHVDRDYRHLLDGLQAPTLVLAGEIPLLPRGPVALPSLLDEPERRLLAAHPCVTLEIVPGAGHMIARQAGVLVLERLAERLPLT